uniref:Uncharacterized protein n=1 Tax=Arundo donax TaxID=35708 RepID=A0A0A9FKS3_ARUDO
MQAIRGGVHQFIGTHERRNAN